MSDREFAATEIEAKVHDLAEAMERAKTVQANRDDMTVEIKQAVQARLELLARDLQPIFDNIPVSCDRFDFALANGNPPRLWIDMTSFISMGADKRHYVFTKDTRLGRTILAQSDDRHAIGRHITDYVAQRILEQEREIEGDWISFCGKSSYTQNDKNKHNMKLDASKESGLRGIGWFLLGVAVSAVSMFAIDYYKIFLLNLL